MLTVSPKWMSCRFGAGNKREGYRNISTIIPILLSNGYLKVEEKINVDLYVPTWPINVDQTNHQRERHVQGIPSLSSSTKRYGGLVPINVNDTFELYHRWQRRWNDTVLVYPLSINVDVTRKKPSRRLLVQIVKYKTWLLCVLRVFTGHSRLGFILSIRRSAQPIWTMARLPISTASPLCARNTLTSKPPPPALEFTELHAYMSDVKQLL